MSGAEPERAGEVRLDPESIEALARRLVELLKPVQTSPARRQLISAEAVSEWWGVGRRWVYDHADELGARRLGSGRRPRLRFDPEEVAERLGEAGGRCDGGSETSGVSAMRGDTRNDSLSGRSRAIVAGRDRKRPGRRANAPRPGAEEAAQ